MTCEASLQGGTLRFKDAQDINHDVLLDIYLDAYRDHPEYGETSRQRARRYLEWLRRHATLFEVVYLDDQPVGWMVVDGCWEDRDGEESAELHELVVHCGSHNKGIGSALLQRALEHARKLGKKALKLWVGRGNEKAIAFYHRHGFEPLYTVGDWLRMRKKLESTA